MPAFPAQCPACGTIFPFYGIGVAEGARARIGIGSDVATPCPKCGGAARISEGIFSANSSAIEIISAPQSTYAAVEALKTIAERVVAGKISTGDAITEAKRVVPEYGPLLERYLNLGLPALAVLLQILATYIAHRDSVSSSEDMKTLLNVATEQTFVLKDIQHQIQANARTPSVRQPKRKEETSAKKKQAKIPEVKEMGKRASRKNNLLGVRRPNMRSGARLKNAERNLAVREVVSCRRGCFAIFAAIRRASSCESSLAYHSLQ
jgi:hypothetical protein